MRTLTIATFMAALVASAGPAAAQRLEIPAIPATTGVTWGSQLNGGAALATAVDQVPVPHSDAPSRGWVAGPGVAGPGQAQPAPPPPPPHPEVAGAPHDHHGSRWGGKIDGHWWGGMHAPGGWQSYRRLGRGGSLPGYWISPSFAINDFWAFGLGAPPYGYHWSRYYDDAVLIDDGGRVLDSVHGLDWDVGDRFADQGYDSRYGTSYGYGATDRYADGYPPQGPGPIIQRQQGVEGYTQTYTSGGYASGQYSSGGYASGGYVSGGYWYPPVTTTTITVATTPIVTTTTTTEYVDVVQKRRTYHKPRHVVRRCCCCCR